MNPWPITPITAKDLSFAVKDYGFVNLTANELAPTDNLLSAVDSLLTDFGASIGDQATLIASMEHDLDDSLQVLREIDQSDFDIVAGSFAGIGAAGSTVLDRADTGLPIGNFFDTGV